MSIATNVFPISLAATLDGPYDKRISDHVDFMLTILPAGTKYSGMTTHPIVGLAVETTIEFEHPLFDAIPDHVDAITQIVHHFRRVVWPNDEGGLKQDNLFIGIEYLTAKGENRLPLYP